MDFENVVKNVQTAGHNGAHTVNKEKALPVFSHKALVPHGFCVQGLTSQFE